MSFLIDPPWLYASGRLYGSVLEEGTPAARLVHRSTAAIFLVTSISLYADRGWTRPIWERCKAKSGRDWMLNSGVFKFEHRRVDRRTHALSALIFLTYPWWLLLGERHARRRKQGG